MLQTIAISTACTLDGRFSCIILPFSKLPTRCELHDQMRTWSNLPQPLPDDVYVTVWFSAIVTKAYASLLKRWKIFQQIIHTKPAITLDDGGMYHCYISEPTNAKH